MNKVKKFQSKEFTGGWLSFPISVSLIISLFLINQGCTKMDTANSVSTAQTNTDFKITDTSYLAQVNLVSDTTSYGASIIDSNLVNAWGLAISDENDIWISSNELGLSTIYNHLGQATDPPVNIPFGGDPNGANPTGDVYNTTASFIIPSTGEKSEFIFATENGTIAAWASGASAITVADRSADSAVYKGITIGDINGAEYLYATNFKGNAVDVFDASFNYVSSITFVDPNLPAGYAPFNIQNISGKLYVTYAKQLGPENKDDDKGPGHGYVDIYNTDGSFVQRFASEGSLNSPWAIVPVPSGIGLLVGNFGDGKINIYNNDGTWVGNLSSAENTPIVIEGLWALVFPKNAVGADRKLLYFTAGPDEESHSLFGYLRIAP